MPRTFEGNLVMVLLKSRHGVWQRAGLDGSPAGINLAEALASLPECNRDFARALLIKAEAGYMAGYAELRKQQQQQEKREPN